MIAPPKSHPQSDYLYKRRGPWPQPQPMHPFGFAPGVVHVPWQERLTWLFHTGFSYMRTILTYWPIALWNTYKNPGLNPLSDATFEETLCHSSISRFLSNELNERDLYPNNEKLEVFKDFLAEDPNEEFFVQDFSLVKDMNTYKGIYAAPTWTLFKGKDINGRRKVLAIYFTKTKLMLTPDDGNAWELAKYFAMQGGSIRISLSGHANLHFPYDSINAITKSCLPIDSVLFRLLIPHFELTLTLNYSVLNSSTSPLANPEFMPYSALPAANADLGQLFVYGYAGMEGNPSYKIYDFPLVPTVKYSQYYDFQMAYYDTILNFTQQVVKQIPKDEFEDIKIWANYIKNWVPDFPSGDELFDDNNEHIMLNEEEVLTKAMARVIWDLSIGHAADHYDYSKIDINIMPFRLRVPPPVSKDLPNYDRSKLVRWYDIFKHDYERKMFFVPRNVRLLQDVKYDFNKPHEAGLRELNVAFIKNLKETDAGLEKRGIFRYMPLDQIPTSIQY
jgi:hypothetical protein